MAFSLKHGETMVAGLRRLLLRAVDRALAAVADPAADPHRTVHGVRRRCNEVRALLRLARGAIDPAVYKSENARFRDLRHRLGGARDRAAALEAFDKLYQWAPPEIDRGLILPLRHALAAQRDQGPVETRPDLAPVVESLLEARRALANLDFAGDGFAALAPGLTASYRRARAAWRAAEQARDGESLHEWRKQLKHHRQHLRVLRPLWPGMMKPLAREGALLAAWLGDAQDLTILLRALETPGLDRAAVRATEDLIGRRQRQLQADALALGRRLHADRPKDFLRRMEAWSRAWVEDGKRTKSATKRRVAA